MSKRKDENAFMIDRQGGDQEHDYNHSQPQRSAVTKGWAESEIVFQGHRLLRQYVQGFQVPGL